MKITLLNKSRFFLKLKFKILYKITQMYKIYINETPLFLIQNDELVTDSLDTDTIYTLNGVNFNPTSEIKNQVISPNLDFVKPTFEGDSIFVNSGMTISPTPIRF